MNGVAPGTLLVARYRLDEQLPSDLSDVTAFSAHDQILDRSVRISIVSGEHVAEALDSARRAALVVDPRLTRVLDVGAEGDVAYVVTEQYPGITLSEVVAGGIVDPQQARAIVGEAAAALEVARRRGVHHLALRPDVVRIDGSRVVVTGLGLDAGVAGHDQHDAERTSRADAVGLVALLYYAMTARWAGPSLDVGWIDRNAIHPLPAQRDAHGVLALSAVRPDVPAELDTLCTSTFAGTTGSVQEWTGPVPGDGPPSPADVVGAVEPWGEVSVVAALPTFVQPSTPAAGVSRQSVRSAFDGATSAPPGTPPPAPPVRRPQTGRIHRVGEVPGSAGPAAAYAAAGATAAAEPVAAPTAQYAATPAQYGAVPPPPPSYDAAATQVQYAQQPAPVAPQPAAHGGNETPHAWSEPAPAPRGPRRFNATPFVLVLVLGLVVAGVVWAVSTAFDGFSPAIQSSEQDPSSGEPSSPAEAGEDTGGEEAPPASDVRPVIAGGQALDPEGDATGNNDGEHPEMVPLAFDGQPETSWISRAYKTPQFGGLRSGIGFAITLEQSAPVSTIVIDTGVTGGNVEIRATSPDSPTGGDVLASGPLSPGAEFNFSQPVEADSIVLWFTELPQNQAGEYRAEINEILVS